MYTGLLLLPLGPVGVPEEAVPEEVGTNPVDEELLPGTLDVVDTRLLLPLLGPVGVPEVDGAEVELPGVPDDVVNDTEEGPVGEDKADGVELVTPGEVVVEFP